MGIISLNFFNLNGLFKETSKDEYPHIQDEIKSSFNKPKTNTNTTAVLLTFNVSENPYSIYIPREAAGTAVEISRPAHDLQQILKLRLHEKTVQATRNLS